jgi:NitT/TauT family transport system substrate-binding protein
VTENGCYVTWALKGAFDLHGGKLIGAMDPAAHGRMEDFMLKDGTIKRTVPPETLLISKPGFSEGLNRFDRNAIIESARACKGS